MNTNTLLAHSLKYAFYMRLMNLCYDMFRHDPAPALHNAMNSIRHNLTCGKTTNIRSDFEDFGFYPGDLLASDSFCGMVNTIGIFDKEIIRAALSEIWGSDWPKSLIDAYGNWKS